MTTIGGFGVTDGIGDGELLSLTGEGVALAGGEGVGSMQISPVKTLGGAHEGRGIDLAGSEGVGEFPSSGVGDGLGWQRGKLGLTLQIPARRSFPIGLLSTFWANSLTEATTTTPTTTAAKRAIGTMPLLRPIYFKHGTGLRCCQEICPQDTPVSKLNLWSKKKKKMR
ncbi:hypothetical protein A2693_00400 [Candidatus Curtissbacteria bacterium RIFCSPHIGHO2_01_FULL_40_12]|uniref:Uncharacterized protein n=1 Tax=Candidatus Curtissbacteria bacterium RIFCSPHIGHO2_01_FULL_40_12 TaxID=1797710 RepID=A0A1F5G996_9BACT|nr:MAG: hypothetical protein A2693_00400 [Candidatus Curtissbacteria bacterium RIFCSPHIGHO2_01_FULL_40_12]